MAFERIDVGIPELAELIEPGIDFPERFGANAIDAALCIYPNVDEAGFSKDAQVFGDGRWDNPRVCSISPTDRSDEASRLRIARRFGSAMMVKADSTATNIRDGVYTCQVMRGWGW